MPVLDNSKHEQFAQGLVTGLSATKAYIAAGYSPKGAQQSSARMLLNAVVCSRIRELQEAIAAEVIVLEISSRNARVKALQKRWDRLREAFDKLLDERGADMAEVPGGSTGLLCRDMKGKAADMPVYRIDPGVVALAAAICAHEKQAAEEIGQWKTDPEAGKANMNFTQTTITLGMLLTDEELDVLEKRAIEAEKARAQVVPA